jgi:hypothetical protein
LRDCVSYLLSAASSEVLQARKYTAVQKLAKNAFAFLARGSTVGQKKIPCAMLPLHVFAADAWRSSIGKDIKQ